MLKITDKSFQYTPSFNTDLKKKFRKLAAERRAAEAEARKEAAEAAAAHSVVPMLARRISLPKA
jgi:hypothetical protein